MMAVATVSVTQAHAEIPTLWTSTLFGADQQIEGVPPGTDLQPLVSITTDRDASSNNLSAMIEKGQITGLYGVTTDGAEAGEQVFPLADIESAKGSVLAVVSGRNALILQGKLDRTTQEGRFRINYLSNGLFMKYKSCDFDLKKDAKGVSYVQNAYTGARVELPLEIFDRVVRSGDGDEPLDLGI